MMPTVFTKNLKILGHHKDGHFHFNRPQMVVRRSKNVSFDGSFVVDFVTWTKQRRDYWARMREPDFDSNQPPVLS